jgi:signal transduction histidine kinase
MDSRPVRDVGSPDRSDRDLEVLTSISRKLRGGIDLDEQLGMTLRAAVDAVGANRASVMLLDDKTRTLAIHSSVGLPPEAIANSIPLGEGIAGWVAEHNEPFILHGPVSDARFEGVDPTIDSSLCLPLVVDDRVLGVLNLTRRPGNLFTLEDLRLASSLADLASLAVEKARLYARLQEREERVSGLLEAAINAQEAERRRIAGEMHDGFLQALTGLFLQTEIAKATLGRAGTDEAMAALDSVQDAILHASEELRAVVSGARSAAVAERGLAPTLQAMVQEVCAACDVEGHFVNHTGGRRLPGAVETVLYRVAQEAVRSAVKHADASRVWVALEQEEGEARLSVRDDGRGVDPDAVWNPLQDQAAGSGLAAIHERMALVGGRIRVDPSPGGGTTISATIPLASFR